MALPTSVPESVVLSVAFSAASASVVSVTSSVVFVFSASVSTALRTSAAWAPPSVMIRTGRAFSLGKEMSLDEPSRGNSPVSFGENTHQFTSYRVLPALEESSPCPSSVREEWNVRKLWQLNVSWKLLHCRLNWVVLTTGKNWSVTYVRFFQFFWLLCLGVVSVPLLFVLLFLLFVVFWRFCVGVVVTRKHVIVFAEEAIKDGFLSQTGQSAIHCQPRNSCSVSHNYCRPRHNETGTQECCECLCGEWGRGSRETLKFIIFSSTWAKFCLYIWGQEVLSQRNSSMPRDQNAASSLQTRRCRLQAGTTKGYVSFQSRFFIRNFGRSSSCAVKQHENWKIRQIIHTKSCTNRKVQRWNVNLKSEFFIVANTHYEPICCPEVWTLTGWNPRGSFGHQSKHCPSWNTHFHILLAERNANWHRCETWDLKSSRWTSDPSILPCQIRWRHIEVILQFSDLWSLRNWKQDKNQIKSLRKWWKWGNHLFYPRSLKPSNDETHHLLIFPKREKIISKSSAVVTGFNLHTNNTFSGGAASTSGMSPTYKRKAQHKITWTCKICSGNVCASDRRAFCWTRTTTHQLQNLRVCFRFLFLELFLYFFRCLSFHLVDIFVHTNSVTLKTSLAYLCAEIQRKELHANEELQNENSIRMLPQVVLSWVPENDRECVLPNQVGRQKDRQESQCEKSCLKQQVRCIKLTKKEKRLIEHAKDTSCFPAPTTKAKFCATPLHLTEHLYMVCCLGRR